MHAQLTNFSRLHSFGFADRVGFSPHARVIEASDGMLYGTTEQGGRSNGGTVFRVRKDGTDYKVLRFFGDYLDEGTQPSAPLVEGLDGFLYGTTRFGGAENVGTIFKVQKDGRDFTVLHFFHSFFGDGSRPETPLIQGSDGALYGTTLGGGDGYGVVFKINTNGTDYQLLQTFSLASGVGAAPRSGLLECSNMLYGVTQSGGTANNGTLYRLNKDGSDFTVLHNFGGASGYTAVGELIKGSDGRLYGATMNGGGSDVGTVFKINADGTGYDLVHSFFGDGDASGAIGPLVEGSDGSLYGITVTGGVLFRIDKGGSNYVVLHRFSFLSSDGWRPSGITQGSDGALYGTTSDGGATLGGTVFRMSTNGAAFTSLWSFTTTGGDAAYGLNGLTQATNGILYGLSQVGGLVGKGATFKLNPDGSDYTVLRSFGVTSNDASIPSTRLIIGRDGAFYGATREGGNGGQGTVFRMERDGSGFTVVHHFIQDGMHGFGPGTLLQASDGLLYGTTPYGPNFSGGGTIFRLATNGSGFSTLFFFDSQGMGARNPQSIFEGSDGMFYGVTGDGGANHSGVVFKINRNGSGYVVLHSRDINTAVALMEGNDGALYGTTSYGGAVDFGTIFSVSKNGGYTLLHHFGLFADDGVWPRAGLVQGPDGWLYGTTGAREPLNNGVLFRIQPDGIGYTILHRFSSYFGGPSDPRSLFAGHDGALYGVSENGGDLSKGTVFRLGHALNLSVESGRPTLTATGLPGVHYSLEKSTELRTWTTCTSFDLPASLSFSYEDTNAPAAVFYRLRVP